MDNQLKRKIEQATRARERNKNTGANKKAAWLLCGKFSSNTYNKK